MYFFAFVLPPLSVARVKPQAIFANIVLTILGWVPGIVHALILIKERQDNKRTDRIVEALEGTQKSIGGGSQ